MPHLCPRVCSRLATAAVFISVGVVQFIVGIILLRSKYVYLLAVPDFFTAFFNVVCGCLLGMAASVWKQSKKRPSRKHNTRRNVILALLFSVLLMNITTLGILVLGEGNTLMSIRLESNGRYTNQAFVVEILAYAYATSVCSPIVCIVVAIVAIAGNCFSSAPRNNSIDLRTPVNSLKKNHARSLQWVYTPELLGLARKYSESILTSSTESSTDEISRVPIRECQRNANSVEDLQEVLRRMAEGKRDNILSDSAVMLRQMDLRRKNRHDSLMKDGSYIEPNLTRTKEFAASARKHEKGDLISYDRSPYVRNIKSNPHVFNTNPRMLSNGITLQPMPQLRNKQYETHLRNFYYPEVADNKYQNVSEQLIAKRISCLNRNLQESLQSGSEINNAELDCSEVENRRIKDSPVCHKSVKIRSKESDASEFTVKHPSLKRNRDMLRSSHTIEKIELKSPEASANKEISPGFSDCFSPDDSEFGADSFEFSRSSSWAGEMIPISVLNSSVARLPDKLIPVKSPVVPDNQKMNAPLKSTVTAIIESKRNEKASQDASEEKRKLVLSSFRGHVKTACKENMLEYPKVGSQSAKQHDFAKCAKMASISEEPVLEVRPSTSKAAYSSSSENETTPKKPKVHLKRKALISAYSESLKETNRDKESPVGYSPPKRKLSAPCKSLRRIWSSAGSEKEFNFLDQVVDEDSLIGLSEEELIARQLRNRSIRKAIQQRIKKEIVV